MLEQFFGSKTRLSLLTFFFNSPDDSFFVRELVKITGMQLNSVRRELENLEKFGILMEDKERKAGPEKQKYNLPIKRKYFKLNKDFVLYKEIKTLIIKSKLLLENRFIEKVFALGNIKQIFLTGIFTGSSIAPVDVLIISNEVDKDELGKLIKKFSEYIKKDINYSVLSEDEYKYRWNIKDRFLFNILEQEKIELNGQTQKQIENNMKI